MQTLSLRLSTIASLIPFGAKVCDIGTDHGYLPIFLAQNGKVSSIIATDINEKPLETARRNIKKAAVCGVELRLGNGLSQIKKGEVDTVVIAGMGGEVIADILKNGSFIVNDSSVSLILQPTTSPEHLRRFLCFQGFEILSETPVFENAKVYSVLLCRYTGKKITPHESFFYIGKLDVKNEFGMIYLKKQAKRCFDCMTALKGREEKKDLFESYRAAFLELEKLLNE